MAHLGFVAAVVFSPDGDRLYSGGVEGSIEVWDTASGERLAAWDSGGRAVRDLALSEDGRSLWSACKDGGLRRWDTASGRCVEHREGPGSGGLFAVALHGERLAWGAFDGTIRVASAARSEDPVRLQATDLAITDLSFLSDTRLAASSRDDVIRIWDLAGRACVHALRGHEAWAMRLAPLPGGARLLSIGEDGALRLWDATAGELVWTRPVNGAEPTWGLAAAPDGRHAVTGAAGATELWDLERAEVIARLPREAFAHRALRFSPDGTKIALGGDDGTVLLYDRARPKVAHRLRGESRLFQALTASPDGRCRVSAHTDGALTLRSAAGERRIENAHAFMAYALRTLDAERYLSAALDGSVHLWRFGDDRPLRSFAHRGSVFAIGISADGRSLLSAGDGCWRLWELDSGKSLGGVEGLPSANHTLADLSPDGRTIVSGGEDDRLRVWNANGRERAVWPLPWAGICAIRVPTSDVALYADNHGIVWECALDSGERHRLHAAHEDWVRSLDVSADGRHVLSVDQELDAVLWDRAERRPVDLPELAGPIGAAVLVDGGVIAIPAAGPERHIRVSGLLRGR